MYDFNRLFFEESYNKCLKQADKSFCVGIVSGITGLLFFVAALSVIYFANTKTNFDLLNENFDNEIENIDDGIKKIDEIKIKSDESESKSAETDKEIRTRLVDLKNELEHLSLNIQRDLTTVNNKYLVIVGLLGGGFLELIAIVNFVQYGKVIAKVSDSTDRNQMFHLAYSIYEKLDNELEKKAFLELMQKIIPNVQSSLTDTEHPNKDKSNGKQKQLSDSGAVKT